MSHSPETVGNSIIMSISCSMIQAINTSKNSHSSLGLQRVIQHLQQHECRFTGHILKQPCQNSNTIAYSFRLNSKSKMIMMMTEFG
jgi:hypothetical protein